LNTAIGHSLAKLENNGALFLRRALAGIRKAGLRPLSLVLFFGLWQLAVVINDHVIRLFNPILIPSPLAVLQVGYEMSLSGELEADIVASVMRVIEGFGIAAVVGITLGTLVARSKLIADLFEPVLEMLRPIPSLAFLPMLILWFGIGEVSKVIFIAYAAMFPIFATTLKGVKYADPLLLRAAATLGASRRKTFWYVVLPAALPDIITGLRIGFGMAFHIIVAAEFIAADSGLGYLINDSRTYFLVPRMLLGAAVIGIIGYLFHLFLQSAENRLLAWRGKEEAA
jgi:ABC-type nitrate/sulfonate/bicarbonate transport system permease component